MRILWLSTTPGLLHEGEGTGNYGGSGWIGALQRLFEDTNTDYTLGLSFISHNESNKVVKNGVTYYPIYIKSEGKLEKLFRYYGGFKFKNTDSYVSRIQDVLEDFKPDIIHLFGIENPMACILGKCKIPIIVHLQGLLGPINNAFFPIEINRLSFICFPTIREWILRNGFLYDKKILMLKAARERELFLNATYFMGRTEWDYQISSLMSPNSHYFKVNEVLRPLFYNHKGEWQFKRGKFIIISTISETIYKGLDLILKTAKIFKKQTNVEFEWRVAGVRANSRYAKLIESVLDIQSTDVNIKYLGILKAEQLITNFLDSSVYVHPSYIDNSPNSVCEAQMIGLPVIATNVGGVSSLISNKKTGILVPANSPYDLAYWLKEISQNIDLAKSLGKNGNLASFERHDKNSIITELLHTYKTVLNYNE